MSIGRFDVRTRFLLVLGLLLLSVLGVAGVDVAALMSLQSEVDALYQDVASNQHDAAVTARIDDTERLVLEVLSESDAGTRRKTLASLTDEVIPSVTATLLTQQQSHLGDPPSVVAAAKQIETGWGGVPRVSRYATGRARRG